MPGETANAASPTGGRLPATLGFLLVAGPILAAIVAVWLQPLPAPLHSGDATASHGEDEAPLQYFDLPDPLSVAVAEGQPRLQLTLAIAVRGELEKLLPLRDSVLAKTDLLKAAMLLEAQTLVAEGADSEALHKDLPARLRDVINTEIGTEDMPTPVEEVLITSMTMQG